MTAVLDAPRRRSARPQQRRPDRRVRLGRAARRARRSSACSRHAAGYDRARVAAQMGYAGEPLSMHPIVASGAPGQPINGLRSPGSRQIAIGDGISCGIGYGDRCCRRTRRGRRRHRLLHELRPALLPGAGSLVRHDRHWRDRRRGRRRGRDCPCRCRRDVSPMLNPEHLISDEWVHSPIERAATFRSPPGWRCSATSSPPPGGHGAQLRGLRRPGRRSATGGDRLAHPELWARINRNRDLMQESARTHFDRRRCHSRNAARTCRRPGSHPRWSAPLPRAVQFPLGRDIGAPA